VFVRVLGLFSGSEKSARRKEFYILWRHCIQIPLGVVEERDMSSDERAGN